MTSLGFHLNLPGEGARGKTVLFARHVLDDVCRAFSVAGQVLWLAQMGNPQWIRPETGFRKTDGDEISKVGFAANMSIRVARLDGRFQKFGTSPEDC